MAEEKKEVKKVVVKKVESEEAVKPSEPKLASEKDVEVIKKVISPEGEFEITVDNKKRKIFWARMGYDSKVYYTAYFKKKLKEVADLGLISRSNNDIVPVGAVDGKNQTFVVEPHSVVSGTMKAYKGSTLYRSGEYSFNPELRVLYFFEPPLKPIRLEFESFDQELWDELYQTTTSSMLIFLCARDPKDHSKRSFNTPEEVGEMNQLEINTVLSKYMEDMKVSEEDLKNLQASLQSGEGSDSPKNTESTHSEEKSGETKEEATKKTD